MDLTGCKCWDKRTLLAMQKKNQFYIFIDFVKEKELLHKYSPEVQEYKEVLKGMVFEYSENLNLIQVIKIDAELMAFENRIL